MNRRDYLLQMRQEGKLKGKKPCFVLLKQNGGKIYTEGTGDFIMSYKDGTFYFQRLSFFFKVLKPKHDFTVNAKRFKEYRMNKRSYMTTVTFYDASGLYLEVHYQTGTKETYTTEDNMYRIIKELEELGLKQVLEEEMYDDEEESDSTGEESN